ncbi:MAG TPA: O-antigen ligase family protein [Elusimicrobiota bacterium]|nr:O-antigen ligase family protein [Elusimicrobiota bacterium]
MASASRPELVDWVGLSLCLFAAMVPVTIAGANVAWGAVLAALLARGLSGRVVPRRAARGPLELPLWVFLAAALLAASLGTAPLHSLRHFHQDAHKVWLYYLLSTALAASPAPCVEPALAAGFAVAACVGVGQSLSGLLRAGVLARAHAFVHPVTFGEQACLAALGAGCYLARGTGRSRVLYGLAALFTAALFLSNTRGALLGAAAGAVAAALAAGARPRRAAAILALAALAAAAGDLARFDRSVLAEAFGWREIAAIPDASGRQDMRLVLWKAAWRMGKDHLWTGVGPNNFPAEFPRYYQGVLEGGVRTWGTAHNLYLHHFAERGLAGVAALAAFLWALVGRAWRRARRRADPWNLWALASCAAFLVMNLTEVALQTEILWMAVLFIWLRAEALHRAAGLS